MTQGLVVLFSDKQFAGSSVPLDEGDTRFTAAFNDSASSIRVAPGYCAMMYEHANEFGGYGAWVDLLEDCPDLSVYGFDKKTSDVRVFRAVRDDGFIWARSAMRDGQFIPGHWERKRANGASPNTSVAVVAPPIPPRTTPMPADGGGVIVVRDHRGEPPRHEPGTGGGDPIVRDHRKSKIKHVFVLMLENRSFDHMLGFSGITGTDAATGQPTAIDGLKGSESNSYNGVTYSVKPGAPDRAPHDPPHGFPGVLEQLCGDGAAYSSGAYPAINNSGFVSVYAKSHPEMPDGAMRCFTPNQVPVLTALAREFVVCDRWFCSMPGPTEPNRWFVHAATAGFFDEGPTKKEYAEAFSSPWSGIAFSQGTIFDRLKEGGHKWRIYACDSFPNAAMLKGVSRTFDVDDFEDFASDVASPSYDAEYTFIEPSYDAFSEYEDGNSHHPLGSVRSGELLIKQTYEALRKSPLWESSVLIITYDEHGGFYDHVAPPAARPTGSRGRKYGFTFDRLGPRVPAVVISPLIPRNLIDHRTYEHSSIVSTVVRLFDLKDLGRSPYASDLKRLATLDTPRTNAPMTLPNPMGAALARVIKKPFERTVAKRPDKPLADDPTGRITATILSGLAQHLEVTPPGEHEAIVARVNALQTQGEALEYLKEVDLRVKAARQKMGVQRSARVRAQPTTQERVA